MHQYFFPAPSSDGTISPEILIHIPNLEFYPRWWDCWHSGVSHETNLPRKQWQNWMILSKALFQHTGNQIKTYQKLRSIYSKNTTKPQMKTLRCTVHLRGCPSSTDASFHSALGHGSCTLGEE